MEDKEIVQTRSIKVPVEQVSVWPGAVEIDDRALPHEQEIFETSGQRNVVDVRKIESGYEAITHTHLVQLIREHNEQHPEKPRQLSVRVLDLDDRKAYRLVAQMIDPADLFSPLARGRFYQRAVAEFGSEADVARLCAVHRSTVQRSLDVARTIDEIGDKITVHHDLSYRDASWYMAIVGRDGAPPSSEEAAALLRQVYEAAEPQAAKDLIAAMREAVQPPEPKGDALTLDDVEVGRIRRKGEAGPIRIDLNDAAGTIELTELMKVLKKAIAKARTPKTI